MKQKPMRVDQAQSDVPTVIEFLLDETGSMTHYISQTIGGFNDFIDEQRRITGSCLFTLTKFDTSGLRTPYVDLNITMVPHLTRNTFVPNALTNLRDAIVNRVHSLNERLALWDITPKVLFVCMTDGIDNASNHTVDDTRRCIADSAWQFIYLGAHENAEEAARELGFAESNIRSFKGAQMREVMHDLSTVTTAYRSGNQNKISISV